MAKGVTVLAYIDMNDDVQIVKIKGWIVRTLAVEESCVGNYAKVDENEI